ncbi:MAG TPA: transcriptional regulator [Nevskiaceae bacterium]|nr:transcriptional regulator [Nevskiaceae bacterium]
MAPDNGTPGLLDAADPVLEHRVRLAACVLLAKTDEISFSRFKELLQQTDGNLGAQLRKLEDEGYVSLRREFQERKPVTWYRLTANGRKALKKHIGHLEGLIAKSGI